MARSVFTIGLVLALGAIVSLVQAQPAARQAAPGKAAPATKVAAPRAAVPQAQPAEGGALKDPKQKLSYAFGLDIGRTLKMQDVDVDFQVLARGLKDGLTDAAPLLNDEQLQQVMQEFQQQMIARENERVKTLGSKNSAAADQFVADNKTKQGVVTLPSGLQYKVIKQGTGQKPKRSDYVKAHYRGTLLDGTEFDSSYKRGEPSSFAVDGVIEGWKEALQLMPVGSKWQLFVPANLAYGPRSPSPLIEPNSLLVFEVELLGIEQPGEELPVK